MDLSNAQRRHGPISEEVRKYRCENNLCSYCSGAGHCRADCPAWARNQYVNAAASAPPEQPPTKPTSEQGGVPLYKISKNLSIPWLLMASYGVPGYILVPSTLFPFPLLVLILFLSWRKFISKDLGKFWVFLASLVKDLLVEFVILLLYDYLLCLCLEN